MHRCIAFAEIDPEVAHVASCTMYNVHSCPLYVYKWIKIMYYIILIYIMLWIHTYSYIYIHGYCPIKSLWTSFRDTKPNRLLIIWVPPVAEVAWRSYRVDQENSYHRASLMVINFTQWRKQYNGCKSDSIHFLEFRVETWKHVVNFFVLESCIVLNTRKDFEIQGYPFSSLRCQGNLFWIRGG
jgi:hypothetical protein